MAHDPTYVEIPEVLNSEARMFGFPVPEFLLLILFSCVAANANGYFFAVGLTFIFVIGKIRKKKPSNWLTFLPYLWFKIKYPYLLPAGRKTFLP